jgi:hypothetical protein
MVSYKVNITFTFTFISICTTSLISVSKCNHTISDDCGSHKHVEYVINKCVLLMLYHVGIS